MNLMQKQHGHTTVISLNGEVTMHHCARLRPALLVVAGKQPVVVDLSGVTIMDTAGLANLVEAYGLARQGRQSFKLASPSESLSKMLHLTKSGSGVFRGSNA